MIDNNILTLILNSNIKNPQEYLFLIFISALPSWNLQWKNIEHFILYKNMPVEE
jgi:hypothetical protein